MTAHDRSAGDGTTLRGGAPCSWRVPALLGAIVMATVALAACGSDDSGSTADRGADTTETEATTTTAIASSTTGPATTEPGSAASGSDAAASSTPDAGGGGTSVDAQCPDVDLVGEAIGIDVVVDEDASVQVSGFCPYVAAADPDSLLVSITFTAIDVTAGAGGDNVDGVGQSARWESVTDQLSVWNGEEGLLVMVSPFGIDLDARQAAIDLANAVLND